MTGLSEIPTPSHCIADVCMIPIGTSSPSVSQEVAEVQCLIEKSGLTFHMHSAGTTIEGPWDKVLTLIGQAHTVLHDKGLMRVHSDIRVGSRTDKKETMEGKVASVQRVLAKNK
ncbi:hypothetical protein H112_01784 [Trichophyton rubrum D6]|uniref:Thiamine-binding protein domain-containing protein n=7 Tax=Trichophyton TaxID=5550 RepID=A0A178F027_TRIRU|nr:uncharacterized protein TERG_06554 [Trichophyton rubrum CBS 118892]EZF25967.1 hypothetical protein H100_01780 [Trichophyton rubrum MR850]EZF45043.1 hypothetical protein H102_01774 [Trichophyton rubrum CBS 100081]EZF55735.1 hypothetical protein H103_01784 [Trichophyton rubrum CBS 288.86]EZF66280.1 hypothetical protein H104_01762 [Trichophyton rubrum CBS 289.86]EZF76961.1 hypothetical protein H105_01789 [Trichophyton soudanense CBS 452.61]EZF87597.1 hypothetical protein H110_01785 [Trichophy